MVSFRYHHDCPFSDCIDSHRAFIVSIHLDAIVGDGILRYLLCWLHQVSSVWTVTLKSQRSICMSRGVVGSCLGFSFLEEKDLLLMLQNDERGNLEREGASGGGRIVWRGRTRVFCWSFRRWYACTNMLEYLEGLRQSLSIKTKAKHSLASEEWTTRDSWLCCDPR